MHESTCRCQDCVDFRSAWREKRCCVFPPPDQVPVLAQELLELISTDESEFLTSEGSTIQLAANPDLQAFVDEQILPQLKPVHLRVRRHLQRPVVRIRTDQGAVVWRGPQQEPSFPRSEALHDNTWLLLLYLTPGPATLYWPQAPDRADEGPAAELLGALEPIQAAELACGAVALLNAAIIHSDPPSAQGYAVLVLPIHSLGDGYPDSDQQFTVVTRRLLKCNAEPLRTLSCLFDWMEQGYDASIFWEEHIHKLVHRIYRQSRDANHLFLTPIQWDHWQHYWREKPLPH